MAELIWKPTEEYIKGSNVKRFMNKHGIKTYDELITRSTSDIEWFWDAVCKDLNFSWQKPYTNVLDTSKGIPWAKWFSDGKINITFNCVDRHKNKNKIAFIWEGEDGQVVKMSYAELFKSVVRISSGLTQLGIKKGDVVGLYMPMIPEAVVAMLAILRIGAIYTPVFSGYGAQAVATRLADCDAKLVFTADGFYRRGSKIQLKKVCDEAVSMCPSVKNVIVKRRLGLDVSFGKNEIDPSTRLTSGQASSASILNNSSEKAGGSQWIDWDDLIAKGREDQPVAETDSEDPFMVIYTSGTTGKPKGSVHAHGGFLVKITEEVAYQTDLRGNDILFWVTDMGWIMAPWEIVGGLALGGTLFFYEGAIDFPKPDRLWDMVERHKITTLGISPTAIRALMKYGEDEVKKHDLSSLRILASTGETWNPESYLWFSENVGGGRCPIINLSGGTEVGACFLSPHPITEQKVCSLRGPALGMDIDVVNQEGKSIREEVGELVCRKPWPGMTRGIWKDPERYIETYWSRFKDVWVHGDWASVDKDGFWFLHGRSDDTIKIAGKRVGPAEVESALASHNSVLESAAVGVPHDVKGEALVCFVVLRPGNDPTEELRKEVSDKVVEHLGKPMKPQVVKFVKQLPKTRNAKILRRVIRAKYLGKKELGDLSNLESQEAVEEIGRAV